jgi:hypothetical protein
MKVSAIAWHFVTRTLPLPLLGSGSLLGHESTVAFTQQPKYSASTSAPSVGIQGGGGSEERCLQFTNLSLEFVFWLGHSAAARFG